jgi:hypothetical protein
VSEQQLSAGQPSSETPSPTNGPDAGRTLFPQPFPIWLPPLFFIILALIFLWRALFTGEVFLPASLLGHVAPWKSTALYGRLPLWNPLRWDGIGQFYPWRKFAAETLRSGVLPLWNPYQFCGTPFVANSQSAVFYPGNLLFVLIPDTAHAFGWSAALHLTLCGWFMYLLLRRLRCSEMASLLGGVVYAYSAWQAAWLQLPTFLATSCWFPLLLRQIYGRMGVGHWGREHSEGGERRRRSFGGSAIEETVGVGVVVGVMLLGGHLQIALYGLIAGTCFAVGLLVVRRARLSRVLVWGGGLVFGLMLAMPQLLPAIELSRISHRVGRPTAEGYSAYIEYGLPPAGIAQALLPDLFGGDSDPANPYWGYYRKRIVNGPTIAVTHNPIETAVYVGILPLLLGLFACLRGLSRNDFDRRTVFFALLGMLALLLALGSPVNAPLYFGVPGFAQSGSPARCLVLWALSWSALAALGLDQLSKGSATERELVVVYAVVIVVLGVGLNLTARSLSVSLPGIPNLPLFGNVLARIGVDWGRLALFSIAGLGLLAWPMFRRAAERGNAPSTPQFVLPAAVALVILDLFWTGIGSNPTAAWEQVYPETKGIAYLREHVGHDRIFPINRRWSLFAQPPFVLPDVLPPNGATVFGLRDVQGYDSLFSGRYKAYANGFARPNRQGALDASPPEVGNMVFFQNGNAAGVPDVAAAYAIAVPYDAIGFDPEAVPPVTPLDTGDRGMMVYQLPSQPGRAQITPMEPGSSIAWIEDGPTRVTLSVSTPSDATLSLLDTFLPGWHAQIDGRATSIGSATNNPVLRSVSVPAGKHIITFHYRPSSVRLGLYCAYAMLFLVAMSAAINVSNRATAPSRFPSA